jgi:phosphoribosylamine---glycine ligase
MKVLLVGSGGREHSLAWKMSLSPLVDEVLCAPGNVGISGEPKCRVISVASDDIDGLVKLALSEKIDLTVVGPEAPLVAGLSDRFQAERLRVFGPSARAALLEGSKVFAKRLFQKYGIPSADFESFDDLAKAKDYVFHRKGSTVVKADGLAAGKGVFVCHEKSDVLAALEAIMAQKAFGSAGDRVVIEDCLEGEEASFIAFTDGETVVPLASSQDHKPIYDMDLGPNTGGMGAYSPAPVVTEDLHDSIIREIMLPVVRALENEGSPYMGFLYAGVMIKDGKPKVLEFNVRMGDPEAQPLLFRMKSDPVPLMLAAIDKKLFGMGIEWDPDDAVCVVMASEGYPGSYPKGKLISGLDLADELEGVKVFHAGTAQGADGIVTAGGRVLGVTAKAPGIANAVSRAYEAVNRIHWEGVHYRKDIGKKAIDRFITA